MKKRQWSFACRIRCKTKSLQKDKRMLKKLKHKRARQAKNPEIVYKKTYAWEIV